MSAHSPSSRPVISVFTLLAGYSPDDPPAVSEEIMRRLPEVNLDVLDLHCQMTSARLAQDVQTLSHDELVRLSIQHGMASSVLSFLKKREDRPGLSIVKTD